VSAALLMLFLATGSCSSGAATGPRCAVPVKIATPKWARELPLPPGSYAYQSVPRTAGYVRANFVLTVTAKAFDEFVLRTWPARGLRLQDQTTGEGESAGRFLRGHASGNFKAIDVDCRPGQTVLFLFYKP
jgi:hypothetical protein